MRHSSDRTRSPQRPRSAATPRPSATPLGDDRFQELIRGASAFFEQAERDVVAEKATAIREILRKMADHGLTVADLEDGPRAG